METYNIVKLDTPYLSHYQKIESDEDLEILKLMLNKVLRDSEIKLKKSKEETI